MCFEVIPVWVGRLGEEAEEDTGGDSRTDDAGNIRAHGVHEQVVIGGILKPEVVRDTGRHGHGRYSGVTDERIDFLRFGKYQIEEFDKEDAARRSDDECHESEEENEDCLRGQELRSLCRGSDGHSEQNRDYVGQGVAGGLCKACRYAALAQEVTEEEHTEQG